MKPALITVLLFCLTAAKTQIPVEIFSGHQKSTIDVMFFSFFKNQQNETRPWLFFNRNRASVDYRMTSTTYLPQFGFTEAVSYNHPKLKGFAPVAVVQVLSWGVSPKAGIQYARIAKESTVFCWVVCETLSDPDVDVFLLFRYTPGLTEKLNLFTQLETINALPTSATGFLNLTQRLRIGLKMDEWQFGLGADLNETGKKTLTYTHSIGGFVRHEF